MATESTVTGIHHVDLTVTDVDRSLAFYEAAGLTGATTTEGSVRGAVLEGPNGRLQLTERPSATDPSSVMPVEGPGITHICYQSATVDDLYGRFKSAGATPVSRGSDPVDLGGYGVYYVYARDPDGIMFEVEHVDGGDFGGGFWISHVALASPDLDALVDFYQLVFDRPPQRRRDDIGGPTFDRVAGHDDVHLRAAWFDTDTMTLELWQYLHPAPVAPVEEPALDRIGYNSIVFEVADVGREHDRLVAQGVVFEGPPTEGEGGRQVTTTDPDGNSISLLQPDRG